MHRNAYTMLEMLFTIVIVTVISMISIPYLTNITLISINMQMNDILSLVDLARLEAMVSKTTTEVSFNNNKVCFHQYCVYLSNNYYILSNTSIFFNEKGNLGQGKTIKICKLLCHELVFNVGSGASYEKK